MIERYLLGPEKFIFTLPVITSVSIFCSNARHLRPRECRPAAYAQFRSDLLKHMAMEEKVLLPGGAKAARRAHIQPCERHFTLMPLSRCCGRRQTCCRIPEDSAMLDAECFDPALLTQGEADEKAELHQLIDAEVLMELCPERVVGDLGVPCDRTGVSKRDFFSLGELV